MKLNKFFLFCFIFQAFYHKIDFIFPPFHHENSSYSIFRFVFSRKQQCFNSCFIFNLFQQETVTKVISNQRQCCFDTQSTTFSIFPVTSPRPTVFPPTPSTTSFGNTLKWFQVFYHSVFLFITLLCKIAKFIFSPFFRSTNAKVRESDKPKRGTQKRQQMDDFPR